jgi:hypothetical protein
MKLWVIALCALVACGSVQAKPMVWQPSAGHTQIPLWPGAVPDAQSLPGPEAMAPRTDSLGVCRTLPYS